MSDVKNITAYEALDIVYERFVESLNEEYGLKITWSEKEKWNEDINYDVYCGIIGDILKMACKKPSVTFDEVEVIKDKDLSGYSREREVLKGVNIWDGNSGNDGLKNGKCGDYCLKELVEKIDGKNGLFVFKEWKWMGLEVERRVVGLGEDVKEEERDRESLYENKLTVIEWVEWKCSGSREWRKVKIEWEKGENGKWRKSGC